MPRSKSLRLSFVAALALAFTVLLAPHFAAAQAVSQTAMAGKYSVTLKVLPAEAFMGSGAAMVHDGGAKAVMVNGPKHPNHHMVVFLKENGQPVEHAHVKISYRIGSMGKWWKLPVARMHVKGKGLATTHFGNNVMLKPGNYQVMVKVNGQTAVFHFSL
jgi:hypothetical protein